jgi:Leucine-rich repeat (LRR) protein
MILTFAICAELALNAQSNVTTQRAPGDAEILFAGGWEVGNGGDLAYCNPVSENEFSGYYSLDYLATLSSSSGSRLRQVSSWEESRHAIAALLREKAPELSPSFENFLAHLDNHDDFSQQRIWLESIYGLVDLKDEMLLQSLPQNCLDQGNHPQLVQAVVRQLKDDFIIYNFDADILTELRRSKPLQYSFLMLHEFLWDLSMDVRANFRINRFLHSQQADSLSFEAFRRALKNLGIDLDVPASTRDNFCQRSESLVDFLEQESGLACQHIKSPLYVPNISLVSAGIQQLQAFDFSGLVGVWSIDLSLNQIGSLPPTIFANLTELGHLNLSGNALTDLQPFLLKDLQRLSTFSVAGNRLEFLPAKMFAGNPKLTEIYLSENRIKTIEAGAFADIFEIKILNLSNNMLSSLSTDIFPVLRSRYSLHLANNKINSIDPETFSGINLRILNIEGNEIQDVSFLGGILSPIWKLNLSKNKLDEFSGISVFLEDSAYLHLSQNLLQFFDDKMIHAGNSGIIYELDLSHNQIEHFKMKNCYLSVNLSHNHLQAIDFSELCPRSIIQNHGLNDYDFSHNQITTVIAPPPGFHALSANLSHNALTAIPPGLSRENISMTLDLSHNEISEISEQDLLRFKGLSILKISHNPLSTLPSGICAALSRPYSSPEIHLQGLQLNSDNEAALLAGCKENHCKCYF